MIEALQFSSEAAWLDSLAADFHRRAEEAIRVRGQFHVALSGGSTPKSFYARLDQEDLPWDRIEWWLGDERWVPPTHPESNERMIRETLGHGRPEFGAHFQSWRSAEDPTVAAACYGEKMQSRLGSPPVFDLILLGIGGDGHIASLFPGSAALDEKNRYAVVSEAPQKDSLRLTLTFAVLNAARQIWFLVRGKEKENVIGSLLQGKAEFPAACVKARSQKLYWLIQ